MEYIQSFKVWTPGNQVRIQPSAEHLLLLLRKENILWTHSVGSTSSKFIVANSSHTRLPSSITNKLKGISENQNVFSLLKQVPFKIMIDILLQRNVSHPLSCTLSLKPIIRSCSWFHLVSKYTESNLYYESGVSSWFLTKSTSSYITAQLSAKKDEWCLEDLKY